MPGKVKVKIVSGRNLPIMDRSNLTTDAYVEVKLGSTIYKTDVYRKSLNPVWNSEWFRFEMDDLELQDEPLQIRLMDHDTYSSNDAIGKVYLDLNPLLCNSSRGKDTSGKMISGWIPVYDTMHGIRGEVNLIVKVELFSDLNKFRQSSCGVRFFFTQSVPEGYVAHTMQGFVEELVVNDDPEYQWIDKIRTPRASNEARQTLFSKLSGEVQRRVGLKALELGGNAVIGYKQCFDLEGESGIVVRGIGTAAYLTKQYESQLSPTCAESLGMSRELAELQRYRSFSKSQARSSFRRRGGSRAPRLQRRSFRGPSSSDSMSAAAPSFLHHHHHGHGDMDKKTSHDDTCLLHVHPPVSFEVGDLGGGGSDPCSSSKERSSSFREGSVMKFMKLTARNKNPLTSSTQSVPPSGGSSAEIATLSVIPPHLISDSNLSVAASEPCIEIAGGAAGQSSGEELCPSLSLRTPTTSLIRPSPLPGYKHSKPTRSLAGHHPPTHIRSRSTSRLPPPHHSQTPSPLSRSRHQHHHGMMECLSIVENDDDNANNIAAAESLSSSGFHVAMTPKLTSRPRRHTDNNSFDETNLSGTSALASCLMYNSINNKACSNLERVSPSVSSSHTIRNDNQDHHHHRHHDKFLPWRRRMSKSVHELPTTVGRGGSVSFGGNSHMLGYLLGSRGGDDVESAASNLDSNPDEVDEDSTSDTSLTRYFSRAGGAVGHIAREVDESDTSKDFAKQMSSGNDETGCCDDLSPVSEREGFLLLKKKRGSRRKDRYSKSNLIKRASANFAEKGYLLGGTTEKIKEEVVKFFKRKKSSDDNESCGSSSTHVTTANNGSSSGNTNSSNVKKFSKTKSSPYREAKFFFRKRRTPAAPSCASPASNSQQRARRRSSSNLYRSNSDSHSLGQTSLDSVPSVGSEPVFRPEDVEDDDEEDYLSHEDTPATVASVSSYLPKLQIPEQDEGTSNSEPQEQAVGSVLKLSESKIVEIVKELGFPTSAPLKLYISSMDALLVYEPPPSQTTANNTGTLSNAFALHNASSSSSSAFSSSTPVLHVDSECEAHVHKLLESSLYRTNTNSNNQSSIINSNVNSSSKLYRLPSLSSPAAYRSRCLQRQATVKSRPAPHVVTGGACNKEGGGESGQKIESKLSLHCSSNDDRAGEVEDKHEDSSSSSSNMHDNITTDRLMAVSRCRSPIPEELLSCDRSTPTLSQVIPTSTSSNSSSTIAGGVSNLSISGMQAPTNTSTPVQQSTSVTSSSSAAVVVLASNNMEGVCQSRSDSSVMSNTTTLNNAINITTSSSSSSGGVTNSNYKMLSSVGNTGGLVNRVGFTTCFSEDSSGSALASARHDSFAANTNNYASLDESTTMRSSGGGSNSLVSSSPCPPSSGSHHHHHQHPPNGLNHSSRVVGHKEMMIQSSSSEQPAIIDGEEHGHSHNGMVVSKVTPKMVAASATPYARGHSHPHQISSAQFVGHNMNMSTTIITAGTGTMSMVGSGALHRRSSESDLSTPPKPSGMSSHMRSFPNAGLKPGITAVDQYGLMEYPFITISQFPPGFLTHIGGTVTARSVKLLERISNLDEPESRDAWWNEIRMEIRAHCRAFGCTVVVGYEEHTTMCDDVCVLSASGTAAIATTTIGLKNVELLTVSTKQGAPNPVIADAPCPGRGVEKDRAVLSKLDSVINCSANNGTLKHILVTPTSKLRHDSDQDPNCSMLHIPSSPTGLPFPVKMSRCQVCRKGRVPDVLIVTVDIPPGLHVTGKGTLIQAQVFRPKKDCKGEISAKEVSDSLPFLEYELHRRLINKLKVKGMNAIFGLKVQICLGDRLMVAVATGTAMYVTALPPPGVPIITAGNLKTDAQKVLQYQKVVQDVYDRNRSHYDLNSIAIPTNGRQSGSSEGEDSDEDENAEIQCSNKDTYILEVDDAEDIDIISMLIDPHPTTGFLMNNIDYLHGYEEHHVSSQQMFTQVWRCRIPTLSLRQFTAYFERLIRAVSFKLRKMMPCVLSKLSFRVELPEPDEMQISIIGLALGMVDVSKLPPVEKTSSTKSGSILSVAKEESELIFPLEDDGSGHNATSQPNTARTGDLPSSSAEGTLKEAQRGTPPPPPTGIIVPAANDGSGTAAVPAPLSSALKYVSGDCSGNVASSSTSSVHSSGHVGVNNSFRGATITTTHTHHPYPLYRSSSAKLILKSGTHFSLKHKLVVEITPLSYIPGARIEKYLGNLNFFFIRETTSIRENGGLSGFVHTFVAEILAIVRAHVSALGGNAMVSYFMTELALLHNPHKNQGQCLINVGGDVVLIVHPSSLPEDAQIGS